MSSEELTEYQTSNIDWRDLSDEQFPMDMELDSEEEDNDWSLATGYTIQKSISNEGIWNS